MIGSAIDNEGWNQALRGNIRVALDVIAIYEVGPLKLEMGRRFFEPLLSPYKIASNSQDPFSIKNGATKGISIFCLNIKGIHKFKIAPILTYALFCSSGRGSEAYWFYAPGACLLLYLVHRLGYKNSSTMNFLPDLWTKSACERRLTVTKPCDQSWNQCALKLVLAISLEKEMLRGEE
ncbi:hypothetical protein VNO77_42103 [Canavalia gladiata]|uniref:Uncharacterized protein n=1 Tax=Canavalia gladiata TaxID=3824 RepID=A0AAN9PQQ1_CANGL